MALYNSELTFYNIDGYSVTSQTINDPFTKKDLKKTYRK